MRNRKYGEKMKISEMIKELQEIMEEHGDIWIEHDELRHDPYTIVKQYGEKKVAVIY